MAHLSQNLVSLTTDGCEVGMVALMYLPSGGDDSLLNGHHRHLDAAAGNKRRVGWNHSKHVRNMFCAQNPLTFDAIPTCIEISVYDHH